MLEPNSPAPQNPAEQDYLKQYRESMEQSNTSLQNSYWTQRYAGACPSCGYCPHCGRGGWPYAAPYNPWPYNPRTFWYSAQGITNDAGLQL